MAEKLDAKGLKTSEHRLFPLSHCILLTTGERRTANQPSRRGLTINDPGVRGNGRPIAALLPGMNLGKLNHRVVRQDRTGQGDRDDNKTIPRAYGYNLFPVAIMQMQGGRNC